MSKKIGACICLVGLALSIFACRTPNDNPENRNEESRRSEDEGSQMPESQRDPDPCTIDWDVDLTQVPRDWDRPKILCIWLDTDLWDGGGEYRGQSFAERIEPTLQEMLAYYCDITNKYRTTYTVKEQVYTIERVTNSVSKLYPSEQTPHVLPSPETWVMTLSASCRASGFIFANGKCVFQSDPEIPPYEEWTDPQEYITSSPRHSLPVANWDMEGREQWVLRQRDNFLFIMSYADYVYARMTLGDESDPFAQNWSNEERPEWQYLYPEKVEPGDYGTVYGDFTSAAPPEGTYYFEPLQSCLLEDATVYRYDASTAEVSDGVLQEAALAMGHDYLQEMCSKEYVPGTTMDTNYAIWDYRNLKATITNRMKDTPRRLREITDLSGDHWKYCQYIGWELETLGLAETDTIWIVKYDVSAKVKGGGYATISLSEDDWVQPETGFFQGKIGIMVKDGSTYYLIFQQDIVPRKSVPV